MAGLVKKLLASASVVAGMSAVFGAPAMAFTFTSVGTDIILREQVGTGFQITNDLTKLDSILQGDSSNPGGNIELGAQNVGVLAGVQAQNLQVETAIFTNVTENIYSSSDWLNDTGRAWFSDAWEQAIEKNSGFPLVSSANEGLFYSIFVGQGGLDIITNPNISYINEVGDDIVVGLASPLNLADRFSDPFLAGALDGVQMSEIFAYDINGVTGYGWSSVGTDTGLGSFNGNYEVVLEGLANGYISEEVSELPTEDVPEPSTLLGLIAIGGFVAAKRKVQK